MATVGRNSPRGMSLFVASTASPDLTDMMKLIEDTTTNRIRDILELVRKDVLYYLKSYTNVMRPPARYQRKYGIDTTTMVSTLDSRGVMVQRPTLNKILLPTSGQEGWRPAHPGGWADVTHDLEKNYKTDLRFEDNGWKLFIMNNSDHAAYVEAMDGFFVVHGVLDPNGPVARSIRAAIKTLGLKWKVSGLATSLSEDLGGETGVHVTPTRGIAPSPSDG